jgi:transposase-like protein
METPKTLLEAITYFSNEENCRKFMISIRWADGVVRCPYCDSSKVTFLAKANVYRCYGNHPKQKFSLKVGTIFEDSPLSLSKWLPAAWLISNCKNGISSYEVARALGITQKSAWHMLHRLRESMKDVKGGKIGGPGSEVETDETYLGGKMKNMHIKQRLAVGRLAGSDRKAIVMGSLDRTAGKVRVEILNEANRQTMDDMIVRNVHEGTTMYTDKHPGYAKLQGRFTHQTVTHVDEYVRGRVHTNGIENFWSLLKRGLNGTYIAVEPFHLERYLDEQVFRYNNRKDMNDALRFTACLSGIQGKRLTYKALTARQSF